MALPTIVHLGGRAAAGVLTYRALRRRTLAVRIAAVAAAVFVTGLALNVVDSATRR